MSKIAHVPANESRLRDRAGWRPENSGCRDNPGVFDIGNGAMTFRHVNPSMPGVVYVEFSSYCGREKDDSWFEADGRRFASLETARSAAAAGEARREREAREARTQRDLELSHRNRMGSDAHYLMLRHLGKSHWERIGMKWSDNVIEDARLTPETVAALKAARPVSYAGEVDVRTTEDGRLYRVYLPHPFAGGGAVVSLALAGANQH